MRKYIAIVAAVGAIAAVAVPVSGATTYPVPKPCKVPNVVGKTLSAAESAITKANCQVGSVTAKVDSAKKGNVIAQKPTSGKGPTVNLTVSLGTPAPGAKCTVPNVVGKSLTAASSAIIKANCSVGKITYKTITKGAAGKVTAQKPAAGATGAVGTAVKLTVTKKKK
jgi:beta-lactam-binding protein with PASTA domain